MSRQKSFPGKTNLSKQRDRFKIMDMNLYLETIGCQEPLNPDQPSLFKLQRHHLLHVPFENLDIHYQREIILDPEAIYEKVVLRKRGGFCYELNGLFYTLLNYIGFKCHMISARVYKSRDEYGPEFDHMALLVEVEAQWYLVDVGFGKFSLEPLPLKEQMQIKDNHGLFIFDRYDQHYWRINSIVNGKTVPEYIFTTIPRELKSFESMCHHHQHNPASHFTRQKVISKALEDGRLTLSEGSIKITRSGQTQEEAITPELFESRLFDLFGIRMNQR